MQEIQDFDSDIRRKKNRQAQTQIRHELRSKRALD